MVFVSHVLPWCTTAKVTEKKRLERNGILGFVVFFLLSELFGCFLASHIVFSMWDVSRPGALFESGCASES